MDSLIQKFLADAESAGLSEGDYLTVANGLKEVFKKVEQPKKVEGLSTIVKTSDFKFTFSSKEKVDDEWHFNFMVEVGDSNPIHKKLDRFDTIHLITCLVEEFHSKHIVILDEANKMTLAFQNTQPRLIDTVIDYGSDGTASYTSYFTRFVGQIEVMLQETL